MRLRKQELSALNLEQLAYLTDQELEQACLDYNFSTYSQWMLPQLVSVFGQWKLMGSGKETVLINCYNDFQKGCWRLTRVKRSLLVKNQTKEPTYATLTPLILLAFKRIKNFSYEQFRDIEGLEWLLEPQLYEALVVPNINANLSKDRLIQIRQQGLEYRTGPKAGQTRQSTSTWQLYGIQNTELGDLPKLTQTILTQCWLAHPQIRRETMILNINNWDNMPEPIIETAMAQVVKVNTSTPW